MIDGFKVIGVGLSRLRLSRICGEALLASLPSDSARTKVVIVSP